MAAETGYVWDSSAVIALMWEEPGADAVRRRMTGAAISSVNLIEAATVLLRRGSSAADVEHSLRALPLTVEPWTEALVWAGLDLSPLAWTAAISLGDRACLTLARALNRTALTADTAWLSVAARLQPPVAVELFR